MEIQQIGADAVFAIQSEFSLLLTLFFILFSYIKTGLFMLTQKQG